jgi:hypothetical protein
MIENVLTLNPVKKAVYQRDPHFTAALNATRAAWTDERSLACFVWNHAGLLLRPEAIVARRSRSIFPVLRTHGLIPVSVRRIHIRPEQAALLWRRRTVNLHRSEGSFAARLDAGDGARDLPEGTDIDEQAQTPSFALPRGARGRQHTELHSRLR